MSQQKDFQTELIIKAFRTVGETLFTALGHIALSYLEQGQTPAIESHPEKAFDSLLTIREACQLLSVGETKFRELAKTHDFGRRLIGHRPRFSSKKIAAFIKSPKKAS